MGDVVAFGFLGLAGLVIGLASIIYPWRFIGIKTRGGGFILAIASFALLIYVGGEIEAGKQRSEAPAETGAAKPKTAQTAAVIEPSVISAPAPLRPRDQVAFIAAINNAAKRYGAALNEMQRGASRPARAKEICASLESLSVNNWRGKIINLSSNGDGKGVLDIKISETASLKTVNNSVSDAMFKSLIDPSSTLFNNVSAMSVGDDVVFSGKFFRDETDCVAESSLTLAGSIRSPEFLMRFTSVDKSAP